LGAKVCSNVDLTLGVVVVARGVLSKDNVGAVGTLNVSRILILVLVLVLELLVVILLVICVVFV
jgi:hypothetical protein